jgi:hypothetical protein
VLGEARTPRRGVLAQPGPVCPEPFPLPGNDRPWLHNDEGVPPAGPGVGEPRPEQAIRRLEPRPSSAALVDGELVPEREDLELQRAPGAEARGETADGCHENWAHRETVRGPRAPLNTLAD